MAVGFVAAQVVHKLTRDHNRKLIRRIIVITVGNIFAFTFKVNRKTFSIADYLYLGVADCCKRICNNCKACNTGSLNAFNIRIVQGKLKRFV